MPAKEPNDSNRKCRVSSSMNEDRKTGVTVTAALAMVLVAAGGSVIFGGSLQASSGIPSTPSLVRTISASHPASSTQPTISSVKVTGTSGDYALEVQGSGFGPAPPGLPCVCDTADFRIGDNAQLGHGEWGYTGDGNTLAYESWNNTKIKVSGLGAFAGDSLILALWNTGSGKGATWAGNAPPVAVNAPSISSVTFTGSGSNLEITVTGKHFGKAPRSLPHFGDLDTFYFWDARTHCGSESSLFSAGGNYFGERPADTVTLDYQLWSNTKISVKGFGGAYGAGCAVVRRHDPVAVSIWDSGATSDTGLQSAWGGRI
jgi:hypothetical protein